MTFMKWKKRILCYIQYCSEWCRKYVAKISRTSCTKGLTFVYCYKHIGWLQTKETQCKWYYLLRNMVSLSVGKNLDMLAFFLITLSDWNEQKHWKIFPRFFPQYKNNNLPQIYCPCVRPNADVLTEHNNEFIQLDLTAVNIPFLCSVIDIMDITCKSRTSHLR